MKQYLLGLIILVLSLASYFFLPESCSEAARRCAAIFIFAAGFWAFNLIPVYVTSLLVVLLLSFSLGKPGGVLNMDEKGYAIFLAPFSSPILMLFFGGFVLSEGLKKNGVDFFLANKIIYFFQNTPIKFLLGVMTASALLSMWISNTAATVIMLGVISSILNNEKVSYNFRRVIRLATPFSANIGGIATPIGTPPNALAIGFMRDHAVFLKFTDWIFYCLPLAFILLIAAWLIFSFIIKGEKFFLVEEAPVALSKNGVQTLVIMGITILLWLGSPIHRIPESLIALFAVGSLSVLRLIDRNDFKKIDWDILILMWGGLALGVGIEKTGLGSWIVQELFPHWTGALLAFLFGTLAFLLSLFISNTAAAALIIPIALEASQGEYLLFGVTTAVMCSIAMIFPVSTPPNALAYATGRISNREMVLFGSIISLISYVIIIVGFWWILGF